MIGSIRTEKESVFLRVLFTIAAVVFVRMIYFIPLPGIDVSSLVGLYYRDVRFGGGDWFDFFILFHAGRLRNISLFSQGIIPFIYACIIVQVFAYLVPGLQKLYFYEKNGRKKMLFAALVVTLALSVAQGIIVARNLELLDTFPGVSLLRIHGLPLVFSTVFSVSAAVFMLLFLARLIERYGIGNGIGIIFCSEVIVRMVLAVDQISVFYARNLLRPQQIAAFFAVVFVFTILVNLITNFRKKIVLNDARAEKFSISLSPFLAGVWPAIFTQMSVPLFGSELTAFSLFRTAVLIMCLNLLYMKIVYQPRRFYEVVLAHGCGMSPAKGKRLEDLLDHALRQNAFIAFIPLMLVYYLPLVLPFAFDVSFASAGVFGCFGIIVFIGILHDIFEQLQFYRKVKSSAAKHWRLIASGFDRPQMEVKKICLSNSGITALIKPSHFTWGLPVRTAGSAHYLYVPEENSRKAHEILSDLHREWKEKAV